jgi:peroxiredoxin
MKGIVRTEAGLPVTGIEVRCLVLEKPNTSFRFARQITDDEGRYVFDVPVGFQYRVQVGGEKATVAQSARYTPEPNADVSVADLVVRPFSARVEGRVAFEHGQPAANLDYGYVSESASTVDARKPPKTDGEGKFVIEHLLPDEPYVFWVFVGESTYHVWRRLDPNVSDLELTLRRNDCIELPPDWRRGRTHEAIARDAVYAEDATIDFALPDLNGKVVSLSELRGRNKAVVVNIMGTWCGGCRFEAPHLVKFYNRYREQGLEVISIAFEPASREKPLDAIRGFKQEFNINYTLLHGGPTDGTHVESVVKGLNCFGGYPTTIYIDRKGKVRFIHVGFWIGSESEKKWQLDLMEGHIRSILSGGEEH